MARKIPVHYLKEDTDFDAEVSHLLPSSSRWEKLNGFDAHIDDCFTIIVVSKGRGTTDLDFKSVALEAGQLGIIAPGQVHSNICVDDCEAWMVRVSPDMMANDYRNLLDEYSMAGMATVLSEATVQILCDAMMLLSRLIDSMKRSGTMDGAVFNMLNVVLAIVTSELLNTKIKPTSRPMQITMQFKRLVMKHLKQEKLPSFYATQLCISEVYLNQAVKKTTGMTPTNWIISSILLEAKRSLRSTSKSVKCIAHELGFKDNTYFSRLFRKKTGLTPLQYRDKTLK